MNVLIDRGRCVGCGACAADCLRDLIVLEGGRARVREGYCMSCGHCVAVCPADAVRLSGGPEEEIRPYRPEEFDIEPERLRNFMQFRRSVRRFQRRPVEEEKLAALLDAARYAPTGANLQQTRYILLRQEKDAVVDLAVKALRGAAERMDTDPLLQGLQPYREMWLEFERAWREEGRDRLFYGAPCVLLTVAGRPRGGTGRLDAGLASANVELMAHALGLGACFIGFFTMAAALEPELYRRLGVRDREEVVSVLALGYPDVTYYRTVNRKSARVTWV